MFVIELVRNVENIQTMFTQAIQLLIQVTNNYRMRFIFRWYFISRKQAKVGFTRFLISWNGMWASFQDLLNLIFMVFNFVNGH